jgi:hypothetical protein
MNRGRNKHRKWDLDSGNLDKCWVYQTKSVNNFKCNIHAWGTVRVHESIISRHVWLKGSAVEPEVDCRPLVSGGSTDS